MYDRPRTRISFTVLLSLLSASLSAGCIGVADFALGWEVRTSVRDRDSGDLLLNASVDLELFRGDELICRADDASTDADGAVRERMVMGLTGALVVFPIPISFPPLRALEPPPDEIRLTVTTADSMRGKVSLPVVREHIRRYDRVWLRPMFGYIELPPVSVRLEPSGGVEARSGG